MSRFSSTATVTIAGPRPSTSRSTICPSSPQNSERPLDGSTKAPSVNNSENAPDHPNNASTIKPFKTSWRFWAILISISIITLAGTVEGTVIVNALPTIVADLGAGPAYIWVPNAFFVSSVAVLPLYAQMSNIFGRRSLLLIACALFVLGSGLCGGSTSIGMLIASRVIQGFGNGGIDMLSETIIMDMVPLRERAKYMSVVLVGGLLGSSLGPFLGGAIVVSLGWRWIFYLNAILTGVAFAMFFFFLKLKHNRDQSFIAKIKRIDFAGNSIFVASVIAVLLALTWAGPVYAWSNLHIILPLILGFLGFFAFTAWEWTVAKEPSFPRAIVSNRTSAAALFMVFISNCCLMWTFYFLPVFFQSVLAKSPLNSGIAIVPISAAVGPFAIVGGTLLSQWGRYKPIHAVAWAFLMTGFGLLSLLDRDSSPAEWACFEIVSSVGMGMLGVTLLPAIQAPLEEKHVATATGMFSFAREFGWLWGVTIPGAIFNNQVKILANTISDAGVASRLVSGQAYQLATKAFLDTLEEGVRDQVISVFSQSMKTVWYAGIAFAGFGLLVSFIQKEVKLRQELNTEFGLEEETNHNADQNGQTRASGNDVEVENLRPTPRTPGRV